MSQNLEELKIIQAYEAEYGGEFAQGDSTPTGIHHIAIQAGENPTGVGKDGKPWLRLGGTIQCGDNKDRFVSRFLRWYGSSDQATTQTRSMTREALMSQKSGIPSATRMPDGYGTAIAGLMSGQEEDETTVSSIFESIAEVMDGAEMYVNVKEKVAKDGNVYSNLYFVPSNSKRASCECSSVESNYFG